MRHFKRGRIGFWDLHGLFFSFSCLVISCGFSLCNFRNVFDLIVDR
jgi:hypothetical protein